MSISENNWWNECLRDDNRLNTWLKLLFNHKLHMNEYHAILIKELLNDRGIIVSDEKDKKLFGDNIFERRYDVILSHPDTPKNIKSVIAIICD